MASFIFLPVIFYNTCIRKRFSDKQNYTDHDNLDNDQIITLKRGNSSNSFDFNDIYSFCRIIELFCMSDGFVYFLMLCRLIVILISSAAASCRLHRAVLSGLIVFTSGKTLVVVLAEVHYVVLFAYNPYSVARI